MPALNSQELSLVDKNNTDSLQTLDDVLSPSPQGSLDTAQLDDTSSSWIDVLKDLTTGEGYDVLGNIHLIAGIALSVIGLVYKLTRPAHHIDAKFDNDLYRKVKGYISSRFDPRLVEQLGEDIPDEKINDARKIEDVLLDKTLLGLLPARWSGDYRNVMIVGEPGTGKSLLLYRMFYKLYPKLRLNNDSRPRVKLLSTTSWTKAYAWREDQGLSRLMSEGGGSQAAECVLLLDALDEHFEMVDIDDRFAYTSSLFDELDRFKAVVATTRSFEGIERFEKVSDIKLIYQLPFAQSAIRKHIKKKYSSSFPYIPKYIKKYQLLSKKLESADGALIRKISRRPLLLRYLDDFVDDPYQITIERFQELAGVHDYVPNELITRFYPHWGKTAFQKALQREIKMAPKHVANKIKKRRLNIELAAKKQSPTTHYELYQRILIRWHGREAKKLKIKELDRVEQYHHFMDRLMQYVAIHIHDQNTDDYISKQKIRSISSEIQDGIQSKYFEDVDQYLERTVLTSGRGGYRFIHKSFYDFYLARYCAHHEDDARIYRVLWEMKNDSDLFLFYKQVCGSIYSGPPEASIQIGNTPLGRLSAYPSTYFEGREEHRYQHDIYDIIESDIIHDPLSLLRRALQLMCVCGSHPFWSEVISLEQGELLTPRFSFEYIDRKYDDYYTQSDISWLGVIGAFSDTTVIEELMEGAQEANISRRKLLSTSIAKLGNLFQICLGYNKFEVQSLLLQYCKEEYKEDSSWLGGKNQGGWTSLHVCTRSGDVSILGLLLDSWQDLTTRDAWLGEKAQDGWTPLLVCTRYGDASMLSLLLDLWQDLTTRDAWLGEKAEEDWTSLLMCTRYGDASMLGLLLDSWQDLTTRDSWLGEKKKEGWTSLLMCTRYGDASMLGLLLDSWQDLTTRDAWLGEKTIDGWTSLHMCTRYGDASMLVLLLDSWQDLFQFDTWINSINDNGFSAISGAVSYEVGVHRVEEDVSEEDKARDQEVSAAIVSVLLEYGAKITQGTESSDALLQANYYGHSKAAKIMEEYIKKDGDAEVG